MKEVILSEHARFQMKERGISREMIAGALLRPDREYTQTSGRVQAIRKFLFREKPYCVVAVYENLPRHYRVITVFITSKVKKYLHS